MQIIRLVPSAEVSKLRFTDHIGSTSYQQFLHSKRTAKKKKKSKEEKYFIACDLGKFTLQCP